MLHIKICYNKPPHLLVHNFFTRGISVLHRPVLYTLHSISGQNIFISYGIETDVCIHPPHGIFRIGKYSVPISKDGTKIN